MNFIKKFLTVCLLFTFASGCTDKESSLEKETGSDNETRSPIISGDDAKKLYNSGRSVILLDVRNQDEFDAKNIPDSILIPLPELGDRLSELPDKNAYIILFCRTGRRTALAAEILINNGYVNVYDMQSIDNWLDS